MCIGQTYEHTDIQQVFNKPGRQADKQTCKQAGRQAGRQGGRQAGRKTHE